jgi:hypothetical protein
VDTLNRDDEQLAACIGWWRRCFVASLKTLKPSLDEEELQFLANAIEPYSDSLTPFEGAQFAADCVPGEHLPEG